MITNQNERNYAGISHYFGLSTDTKPTTTVANGSDFYEIDTGEKYYFNGETKAWVQVSTKYLKSIAVSGATASYYAGQSFSTTGMTVTATYTDNSTAEISEGYTITPSGALTIKDTKVTITYTENGIARSKDVAITVTRNSLTVPSQSGTLTYTGSEQTATFSNYDPTKMTVANIKGTNAGTYKAVFSIIDTDTYQWTDTTTGPKEVSWIISKANATLTLSESSVSLDSETTTAEVTATTTTTGEITATSSAESYATVEVDGNTITITRVAAGSATITVAAAGDDNHNAPTSATITVTVT